jgi:hypothetical protein
VIVGLLWWGVRGAVGQRHLVTVDGACAPIYGVLAAEDGICADPWSALSYHILFLHLPRTACLVKRFI